MDLKIKKTHKTLSNVSLIATIEGNTSEPSINFDNTSTEKTNESTQSKKSILMRKNQIGPSGENSVSGEDGKFDHSHIVV